MSALTASALTARALACGSALLVVHVHIPKTGGTTLSHVMRECAQSRGRQFVYGHTGNFLSMDDVHQRNVLFIDAHMGYGIHMHPRFPAYRRNCTFYATVFRPFVDVVWSAFKHIEKRDGTGVDFTPEHEGWGLYDGIVTRMICCWGDPQHVGNTYDFTGKQSRNASVYTEAKGFERFGCPNSRQEMLRCALRRVCHDYHILGTTKTLSNVVNQMRSMASCPAGGLPHDNAGTNGRTTYSEVDALHLYLNRSGSAEDATLLKIGELIALGDRSICTKL